MLEDIPKKFIRSVSAAGSSVQDFESGRGQNSGLRQPATAAHINFKRNQHMLLMRIESLLLPHTRSKEPSLALGSPQCTVTLATSFSQLTKLHSVKGLIFAYSFFTTLEHGWVETC